MSDPNQQWEPPPPPTIQAEPERKRPANLMWAGIGLVVLGIILVIGGIAGFIPYGIGSGLSVCALGLLLFGFSFMRLPAIADASPAMSVLQTVTGIFFEPTRVFSSLRAHPQWLAAILIAGIVNAAYVTAFYHRLTPDKVVNFKYDKLEESPLKPPPERLAEQRQNEIDEHKSRAGQVSHVITTVVGEFFKVAFVAALCLLGVLSFGGRMHYWQTYAVVAYIAYPVTLIQKAISFIILFLKSPDDIHPILGQETLVYDNLGLLVSSKDHPVLYVIAAAIGVLSFYRLWLTATGLREGGYKVSSSAAWGVTITIFVLFLLFGMGIAAIFPSFLG